MNYHLVEFCRICIETDKRLLDIEADDVDTVKLSDKLKICTNMVISNENFSRKICSTCVEKLRISYQFHQMCARSTTILEHYLKELFSATETSSTAAKKFINSELRVTLTDATPKVRRRRMRKEERCSLLKRLLSKRIKQQIRLDNCETVNDNIHIKGLANLCDSLTSSSSQINKPRPKKNVTSEFRQLLDFTKSFKFDCDFTKIPIKNYIDPPPIELLSNFINSYFHDHFAQYRSAIVHLDDVDFDGSDEEEDWLQNCPEEDVQLWPLHVEEVDVKVEPIEIKSEIDDECDYDVSSQFVQVCYEETPPEPIIAPPIFGPPIGKVRKKNDRSLSNSKNRTVDDPFIHPQLKYEFQMRNFRCNVCNRRFKNQGYLKVHRSKMKH